MQSPLVLSEAQREQRLAQWSASSGIDLAQLDAGQRAVVVAALTFLGFVGGWRHCDAWWPTSWRTAGWS